MGLLSEGTSHSLPVHALQLYFCLLAIAVALFLIWRFPRKAFDGELILLYLTLHESGKFSLEFLRGRYDPYLQLASLVVAVSGAALLVRTWVVWQGGRSGEVV
jgi:prolipoprotein diacylglyceryltransferase